MNKRAVVSSAVLSLLAILVSVAVAQVGVLPIQPNQPYHTVRIVNEMGYPIRVKMVRYGSGRYLEEDLSLNRSVSRDLYAGERVLCVWNRQQRLTLAAQVNVDTSGTLRIRPIAYPAAGAAPLGAPRRGTPRESMEPLPRLKLEP